MASPFPTHTCIGHRLLPQPTSEDSPRESLEISLPTVAVVPFHPPSFEPDAASSPKTLLRAPLSPLRETSPATTNPEDFHPLCQSTSLQSVFASAKIEGKSSQFQARTASGVGRGRLAETPSYISCTVNNKSITKSITDSNSSTACRRSIIPWYSMSAYESHAVSQTCTSTDM